MRKISDRGRFVSRAIGLGAAGLAGLALAAAAASATVTIQVGPLAIVSGTATGTISGFQPSATVTVNGTSYISDGAGTVNLSSAPLGGATTLSIDFVDAGGTAQSVTAPLNDLMTGTPLSPAELLDAIPSTSAPVTLTVEISSGTTTVTTGGTTTGSGGGTGSGGSGGSGGSSGGSIAGAVRLYDGSTSIPASSVLVPYQLVIKQVVFQPKLVRSRQQPITIASASSTPAAWSSATPRSGCEACRSRSSRR